MMLDEVERVERIEEDREGIEAAWRTAYATHDLKQLGKVTRDASQRLRLARVQDGDRAAEMDGLARFQRVQRMLRRRAKRKG
jgi:hypothetical protein